MARIYAVGVGPGDPELLTKKAERIIRKADVICSPTGAEDASSYALSIVEELLDRSTQEIIVQVFPMQHGQGTLEAHWETAADQVIERVDAGKDVVFITIGDPCLYSTFLYLNRKIQEKRPEIPLEIVPGVSSINAAAAAAGIALGTASDRIAILPAVYEDDELSRTLQEFDTIVLMKVNRTYDRIYQLLEDNGLDKKGVFVRRVGSPQQEVIFDLETLVGTKLDYLSMLIVAKNSSFHKS